ncbi:MAG: site-2 protease family protein [candidate division Zixibacteria bacterium]|nr:site-2 protease family protein [candidate division Zixibacteria bacterium]
MPDVTEIDYLAAVAYKILADYFDVTLWRPTEPSVTFWGNPHLHRRGWKRELNRRLTAAGVQVRMERDGERYRLTVFRASESIGHPPLVNTLLFVLTFLTVLLAAAFREHGSDILSRPELLVSGLPFTLALLCILLVHEMGHFVAGHSRGVRMSYPYFIPAPTFLGTFGAIIRTRSPIRTRNDLVLIGAAGPLAGAIPSVIALIWGYMTSTVQPIPTGEALSFGDSLLSRAVQFFIFGSLPPDSAVYLSSIALAGYVGLLVTMLNLLPLGQLDGGHVIYGLFPRRQKELAIAFLIFLFILGFMWNGWWLWMVLALLMRPFHPPVQEQDIPLDGRYKKIGWAAVILFLLTFVPMPIS